MRTIFYFLLAALFTIVIIRTVLDDFVVNTLFDERNEITQVPAIALVTPKTLPKDGALEMTAAKSVDDWLVELKTSSPDIRQSILLLALKQYPYSPQLLIQEAIYFKRTNDLKTAIERLAEAHHYADHSLAAEIDNAIINWMDNVTIEVNKNSDWHTGNALFEHAINHFSDLKPLLLLHAKLLILHQNLEDAQRILDELNDTYRDRIVDDVHHHELQNDELLTRLRNSLIHGANATAAVPLIKMGNHFMVDVLMSQQVDLRLMIDTGATLTVISEDKFIRIESLISYRYLEDRMFNTAGGKVSAPVYTMDTLQIGQFNFRDVRFAVIPLSSDAFDGLIGMNVFNEFEFSINPQEAFLLLKQR